MRHGAILILGTCGFAMIAHYTGFTAAIGVFLMAWAHNLEKHK